MIRTKTLCSRRILNLIRKKSESKNCPIKKSRYTQEFMKISPNQPNLIKTMKQEVGLICTCAQHSAHITEYALRK
jgi:hypothetical protein